MNTCMTNELKIRVYIDDGRTFQKVRCRFKDIIFAAVNELKYNELREGIINEFKEKVPGILDDNYSINIKWKLVSFKHAADLLEDTSKDIKICDDEEWRKVLAYAEEIDSDNSDQSDQSNQSDKKNNPFVNLLVKRFGITLLFSFQKNNEKSMMTTIPNNINIYFLKKVECIPVDTKIIGVEMNQIILGWKLEDVSLNSIQGHLERCKTKGLQEDTAKLWWFEVRVIDISGSMQQRPSTDSKEMEEKIEFKVDLEPLYFTVASDKRHVVLKDLKENSKYEISVRTCIDWLTSKDVNKKIKKESSFTSPLHEKTYKTFEDMLGLLTRPRRPLFPQVINFEATKVQLKWWPAKFSKNDSEDITYRIREYNHHQGVVVATVKDTTKWTFDGLKPQYEYFVTISAVNQQEKETKESWPLVFKTCKENTSDEAELTPASPIDVRLFRFSEDEKHPQWVCWGSPYEGVGKIGYEMQFSSNYKDEKTKFVESIANPLVPSSRSYRFF
ncbi:hypothetical protein RFI_05037, partial [Reticulomyxa filosa]